MVCPFQVVTETLTKKYTHEQQQRQHVSDLCKVDSATRNQIF